MSSVARVALDSPLPNLDRLFDYSIADEHLGSVRVGARVRVTFGRTKKLLDAFVVEIVDQSEFAGKLSPIAEVVSPISVFPRNLYELCRAVADRQASTLGDVLSGAVAKRFVAVEKKFDVESQAAAMAKRAARAKLEAAIAAPVSKTNDVSRSEQPAWIGEILSRAAKTIANGESAIVIAPDFRDLEALRAAVEKSILAANYVDYTTDQTGSKRYSAFLQSLSKGAHLVVGSRSAVYAPLQNLGLIAIFDDGDLNLQDQQSPYAHARDIALLRQKIDGCDLLFVSHSRSCEVQRLVDMNYLTEATTAFKIPTVAFDDSLERVPALAWQAIRESSATAAVLVQVSAKGTARTAYCQACSTRALCKYCNGPIWIDSSSMPRCRWCNAQNLDYRCLQCGEAKIRQGFGGSTRTVAEFGKAFAGVQIVESTGDKPVTKVEPGKKIVIATPGAEPNIEGGYAAVIILDANQALAKDSLRASEDAVRAWSNAIAKLGKGGRAVVAGVTQQLGQRLALWQQIDIARDELENRRELEFPPHIRLASIEGPIDVITEVTNEIKIAGVQVLGPIQVRGANGEQNQRFVVKYPYSSGPELANTLRATMLKLASGLTKTSASGRISRAIRVRMDDPEVI